MDETLNNEEFIRQAKERMERRNQIKLQIEESRKNQLKQNERIYLWNQNPKSTFTEMDKNLDDVLRRIGDAEREIDSDKKEIKRIEQVLTSKLDWNKDIVSIVLVVAVFAVIWLVWQSFWMYPQMIKDYAEKYEAQNTKIEWQNNQIEELKDDISEIKGRIEKEIDRRILLENNVENNAQ